MKKILLFIVALLLPTLPLEGAEPKWSALEYGGSCKRIGFRIQNDTIEIHSDGSFSFIFDFRELPETSELVGNLAEQEAASTNHHAQVGSFFSEQVGAVWNIEVDWNFSACASRLVGPFCHTSFVLKQSGTN